MIFTNAQDKEALLEYVIRIADDRLVISQRMSEWCGHGPFLEEDIALTNLALDLLGQANSLYEYAEELSDGKWTADKLAFFRNEREFKNLLIAEQPNGDYAQTICRNFFFDAYSYVFWNELAKSKDERLVAIAQKSVKETIYHLRHTSQWFIRFGDGTEESRKRLLDAIDDMWMYVGEMFESDEVTQKLEALGIAPSQEFLKDKWLALTIPIFAQATIPQPDMDCYMQTGGRKGVHTEVLGHTLAVMQSLPRSMPEVKW